MKRIIITLLLLLIIFNICGCKASTEYKPSGEVSEHLSSKLENSIELQKSTFIAKVLTADEEKALIPKYNVDITDYSVYYVEIKESLDGVTPVGDAYVYWIGASEEFGTRTGLEKNEQYILDAEPWIYGDKVIYLLAPFTVAYPKIDKAGRVTLENEQGTTDDLGTLQQYKNGFEEAKENVQKKNPDFFKDSAILSRYCDMIDNIKKVNDGNWFRDFDYGFVPSDTFIKTTREYTGAAHSFLHSLDKETAGTDQIAKFLKGEF